MPKTIVIGTGISAAAYLASLRSTGSGRASGLASGPPTRPDLGDIGVAGGKDLWKQVDPSHRMGQPAPLLTGNLLLGKRGFARPPVPGQEEFMTARDFAALVEQQLAEKGCAQMPGTWVEKIARIGETYLVTGRFKETEFRINCNNLIIASGPGPARPLTVERHGTTVEVPLDSLGGYAVNGTAFMSPDWKLPGGKSSAGLTVAVYGGSATAAWAVELAILRTMKVVLWFTRPDERTGSWDGKTRFKDAFPPGERNTEVEHETREIRKVLKLLDVKLLGTGDAFGSGATPFIGLTFRNSENQVVRAAVDVLVTALGSAHTKAAGIREWFTKDPDLEKKLVPFYDRDQAIHSQPSLLAVGTTDRSLMIVGSAMSSAAGFNLPELAARDPYKIAKLVDYREISATLPPAARPTEGIAMVMASIEALNQYMPAKQSSGRHAMFSTPARTTAEATGPGQLPRGSVNPIRQDTLHAVDFKWDINFNTSNRNQLAAFLAQATDLEPFAANLAVALIVKLRGKNTLGLSNPQVRFIIDAAEATVAITRRLRPGLDAERFLNDRSIGAERTLETYVDYATTDKDWIAYWKTQNIQC